MQIPLFVRRLGHADATLHIAGHLQLAEAHKQKFYKASERLQQLFKDPVHIANGAVTLFQGINLRIDFLAWLLEEILAGRDPRQQDDFSDRLQRDQMHLPPQGSHTTKTFPLIEAFYQRIELCISELLAAIERSPDVRRLIMGYEDHTLFSAEDFLPNLSILAEQGNWLARVLVQLNEKLTVYEQAYQDLVAQSCHLPDPQQWIVHPVNLSSGGVDFVTSEHYELYERLCVLFEIEHRLMVVHGRVVNIIPLLESELEEGAQGAQRIGLEFVDLSNEDIAQITRFVAAQELAAAHPNPFSHMD
ncbi:PilZ domain-containing protein [Thiomicrorhabdus sp. zzn3]|uniref:PilZ domain-containing protein n=1 Tax=Thiomicrorhabdus sp. zzn3 TaxID=3039775 RepID=UPI00243733E3|nr:PilZ domain-containing protein [Thiomicrorhabdus sp. zzn3]MDG6778363.1 PilZ domain-containing protein [Thiomicrorhabdus sp. zzn3]